MNVEERSDQLDRKLLLVTRSQHWGLIITLAFIVALNLAIGLILLQLASDNHRALATQIPGLKEQIAAKQQTISDQQFVLEKAVDALLKYQAQIRRLGGTPAPVVLRPPKHPRR